MHLRLGYDTYSLRFLKWNAFQHLDFAKANGCDAIQFSSAEAFEQTTPEYLGRVRARAGELGIKIDTGTGCICELSKSWNNKNGSSQKVLEDGLRIAKLLGAKAMRCYMGTDRDRSGAVALERLVETTAANLKKVRSVAIDSGVTIAVENHKDLQAWQMKTLIEQAGRDFVGANLDLGNPLTLMEHPLTTLEVLGPYTATSHFRDTAVYETTRGAAVQWVAMGDGSIDFVEVIKVYGELCPQASVHLEIITGRQPYQTPYLEPDYWKTFAGMPAKDFARFVALAKHGAPFSGTMVIEDLEGKPAPPQFESALIFQQRADLERSLRFAREKLHLGVVS